MKNIPYRVSFSDGEHNGSALLGSAITFDTTIEKAISRTCVAIKNERKKSNIEIISVVPIFISDEEFLDFVRALITMGVVRGAI